MFKFKAFIAAFGLLLCTSSVFALTNASSEVLNEAINLARESGKNIFVNYTADWCLPCQIFKDQILNDSKVSNLLHAEFVTITADYDDNTSANMFEEYAIACMPTLHVLDKDGDVINEMSGTMTAGQFYDEMYKYILDRGPIAEELVEENRPISVAATMTLTPPSAPTEFYTLQAGAFSSLENAKRQKALIDERIQESIRIVEDTERKLFIINIGRYGSKEELENVSLLLKDASIDHFVKRSKGIGALLDKGI